jgi:sugar lactone lactonase YvrE
MLLLQACGVSDFTSMLAIGHLLGSWRSSYRPASRRGAVMRRRLMMLVRRALAKIALGLGLALCMSLVFGNVAMATLADRTADTVLGQPDLTTNDCNHFGVAARSLCRPARVAVDPTSGRLYVSDNSNSRVLSWPSADGFANAQAADLVLGQSDFTSSNPHCSFFGGVSATGLCSPQGLAVDRHGALYVADSGNDRVVRYSHPQHNGQAADLVLGQPDFTSQGCNLSPVAIGSPTARTLCFPTGVTVDVRGTLYVADSVNRRVLRFQQPLTNFQAANLVLGQPNFTSSSLAGCNPGLSATNLCAPTDVAIDRRGTLYALDAAISRVLRYHHPRISGQAADLVLGQPDFTSSNLHCSFFGGVSATGLCFPHSMGLDRHGNLYVADTGNARVLRFSRPDDNGQAADLVLGQPNFSTGTQCGAFTVRVVSARSLCAPEGVALDRQSDVLVSDALDNRVLRYNGPGD